MFLQGDVKSHPCINRCPYKRAKQSYIKGSAGVTNFSYFLAESNLNGDLKPRSLLVVDEAHNVEDQLSKFVEVTVSQQFAESIVNVEWPKDKKTQFQVFKWIRETYLPALSDKVSYINQFLESNVGIKEKIKEIKPLARRRRS